MDYYKKETVDSLLSFVSELLDEVLQDTALSKSSAKLVQRALDKIEKDIKVKTIE